PRTDIFLIPFPRTRCRGRRRRREPYSNPIRAEIRLPPPCEGRHARSCAPPSIGRPPYRRARRVSRFPHWTSSSILLAVTACASTRPSRLLRPRRERPRRDCAAEQRDELAPTHSITSSARASSDGGISRPSAFAVLRLTTNSILVGCSMGRSVGLAPRKIRST